MKKFITTMQTTKQVFDNLIGIWSIKRILGNYGTAEGIAKFTLQNQNKSNTNPLRSANSIDVEETAVVIHYREELLVKYNTNVLLGQDLGQSAENTAYKEYLYLYDTVRDKIIKKFSTGNLFYELSIDFEKQVANGDHLCINDLYKASYCFTDPQNFSLTYYVKGPQKDYQILTEFTKQLADQKT